MAKPIYILGLHNVRTGGPEAIHQLSDALIEQGFDARMVYYEWPQIYALEKLPADDAYVFGARTNPIEEYAHYKVNVTDAVPNSEDAIVVLPETLCHLSPKFPKATVLIWWLSVDNAFASLARVNLNHLRSPNIDHVAQSQYAARFVEALGLSYVGMLSDYTVDLCRFAKPMPQAERPKLVVFNVNHKVAHDVEALIARVRAIDPGIECIRLIGKSRQQVADLFSYARVYVDLGSLPGKDRMPREAASMNCRPLVLDSGAGAVDFKDWSTDGLGLAERIVREVDKQEEWNWAAGYASERDTFADEVADLFSEL